MLIKRFGDNVCIHPKGSNALDVIQYKSKVKRRWEAEAGGAGDGNMRKFEICVNHMSS